MNSGRAEAYQQMSSVGLSWARAEVYITNTGWAEMIRGALTGVSLSL